MSTQLSLDAAERPALFYWNGAIEEQALRAWLAIHDLPLPEDLVRLLASTGGGDLFESETILGPHGSVEQSDDLVGANEFLHRLGLPWEYAAFHRGLCVSVIERASGAYLATDDRDWSVRARYQTLDAWYVGTLRREYAARYGLPGATG